MVASRFTFASRFNYAVINRKKSFFVPVSKFSANFLLILYRTGYISSYSLENNSYLVYPNLAAIWFTLKPLKDCKTKNFSEFRKFSNSGFSFVANTFNGLAFSDTILLNKCGGQLIFKLEAIYN